MEIYYLQNCSDSAVELPTEVMGMGFEEDSTYYLYLQDYTKDTYASNILEITVLPFKWNELANLYSINMRLANVPGSTANAMEILYKNKVEVRTYSATDSIAGMIGSLDAAILSPMDLGKLDIIFETAYWRDAKTRRFIDGFRHPKRERTNDGRFLGKFITGRKYQADMNKFRERIVPTYPDTASVKRVNNSPSIEIPMDVIKYINGKYRRGSADTLAGYLAVVKIDTEFNSLSISFLNPNEIILDLVFAVKDKPGILYAFCDYCGWKRVNFRVVSAKNVHIGSNMKIELTCDISQTELPLYGQKTMEKIILTELRREISRIPEASGEGMISLEKMNPRYGYPKKLTGFREEDQFEIVDLYHIKDAPENMFRLNQLFGHDTPEAYNDIASCFFNYARVAARNWEVGNTIYLKETNTEFRITWCTQHKDRHLLKCVPTVPDGKSRERYWIIARKDEIFLLVFKNRPPGNLHSNFFEDLVNAIGGPEHLSEDQVKRLFPHVLLDLKYGFPTKEEFEGFGGGDRGDFRSSSEDRFGKLGAEYIPEKLEKDEFVIAGNKTLSNCLKEYLSGTRETREKAATVKVIDIGVGAGAITSLFVCDALHSRGMLDRTELTIVDVSQEVLDCCTTGSFQIPHELMSGYFVSFREEEYKECLAQAKPVKASVLDLDEYAAFDVVVSGFTLHHLNSDDRMEAIRVMSRLAKPGGFVGIVDERLTFEQYLEYRTDHLFDNVALARESFVADIMELAEQLRGCGVEVGDKGWRQEDKFYYLWGAKQTDAISREAEEQVTGADQTVDESGRLPQGEPADPKSEASKLVQSLGPVKLSRYAVVGNHVRYDYHLRDWLKDIHSQILAALGRSTEKIQCFLIWGKSASGKTHFIQEIAEEQKDRVNFIEVNLLKDDESRVLSQLAKLKQRDPQNKPYFCLVDEFDARETERWAYETLYRYMEDVGDERNPCVFVFVGSRGSGISEMEELIDPKREFKGKDVLNRVIPATTNKYEFPEMSLGDKLVIFIASVRREGRKGRVAITELERRALYYVLLNPALKNPRQMNKFAVDAVARVPTHDNRLKYHHLFDAAIEERTKEKFLAEERSQLKYLETEHLAIEE